MVGPKNYYRRVLEKEGFNVEEKKVSQTTLSGDTIEENRTIGVIEGSRGAARVTVAETRGGTTVTAIIHTRGEEEALALASRLEELGGIVDRDGDRIAAKFKQASEPIVASIARETARAVKQKKNTTAGSPT